MLPNLNERVPEDLGELYDRLMSMLGGSPTFAHRVFRERTLETRFASLNQALVRLRPELGEDRFHKFQEMSKQMRACFEADPGDTNGETAKGRRIILEMLDLLEPPPEAP